ncbi:hypothetical protein [Clostridium sp.]|nr:hypothetical protein [Clostridium sp.]MCI9070398.1 hypothetical protein [Clostridium sp.]
MAKNKKRKNKVGNKKSSNIKCKTIIKEENEIKPKGPFINFMSKSIPRTVLHTITAISWLLFLSDFFSFQRTGGVPNPILAILALVTLVLEYSISNGLKGSLKK